MTDLGPRWGGTWRGPSLLSSLGGRGRAHCCPSSLQRLSQDLGGSSVGTDGLTVAAASLVVL